MNDFPFPSIVLIGNSDYARLGGRPPQRIENEDE
jgi:hypothetical protein